MTLKQIKTANETAEIGLTPLRGEYVLTDIYGNQRRVRIVPASKSMSIELLEPSPTKRTNDNYDTFLYKKGSCRLKYDDLSPLYYFGRDSFKVYPQNGLEPLYFEFESKV